MTRQYRPPGRRRQVADNHSFGSELYSDLELLAMHGRHVTRQRLAWRALPFSPWVWVA